MRKEAKYEEPKVQRIVGTGMIPILRAGSTSIFCGAVTIVDFWLIDNILHHYRADIVSIGISCIFVLLLVFAWHMYLFSAVEISLDAECFRITYPIHSITIRRDEFLDFSRVSSRLSGILFVSIKISSGKRVRFHIAPRSYLFESDLEKRYEPILNMLKKARGQ